MESMEMVCLDGENLEEEHICCALGDKKSFHGYEAKKKWLREQFDHGFVFRKYPVRHKVFMEYVPMEKSWYPLEGENYIHINCFWVAGKFKGQGLGKTLLEACIEGSAQKAGVAVISSSKKRPFLGDKKFFQHHGFEVCDTAAPYFELLVRKNDSKAPNPSFTPWAKEGLCVGSKGLRVYYFNGCPYTTYYVEQELRDIAKAHGLPLEICKLQSREEARRAPTPFPLHSLFYQGRFLTQEILTSKRFAKILPLEKFMEKQWSGK